MNRGVFLTGVLGVSVVLLVGCAQPVAVDPAGRLLTMTAEEATSIDSTLERFTRQLNIADTQVQTGRGADADKTLLLARETLVSSKDKTFDSFHRIAGWTAISQLARAAGDKPMALKASDEAMGELNDVMPVAERAEYVLSLSGELGVLKGNADAIELLNSGALWAGSIEDATIRRQALTAFSYRLVSFGAFEEARKALHVDNDAVWRTDTLLGMAHAYTGEYMYTTGGLVRVTAGGGRGGSGYFDLQNSFLDPSQAESRAKNPGAPSFGKDVRFESVYKR